MFTTTGMIVLNEEEFIAANLRQHYALADKIVVVEGADRIFPKDRVTPDGLSIDRTAEIVREFPDPDKKIELIQHGWANGKAELRHQYAKRTQPGILLAVDADEFLDHASAELLLEELREQKGPCSVRIPQIHLWKDPQHVVTGSYFDIRHHRAYRVTGPVSYTGKNHNHPIQSGQEIHQIRTIEHWRGLKETEGGWTHASPFWLHYGFCRDPQYIRDKNQFYLNRGEAKDYPSTTRDRAAWFGKLPDCCKVWPWAGPYPEALATEKG